MSIPFGMRCPPTTTSTAAPRDATTPAGCSRVVSRITLAARSNPASVGGRAGGDGTVDQIRLRSQPIPTGRGASQHASANGASGPFTKTLLTLVGRRLLQNGRRRAGYGAAVERHGGSVHQGGPAGAGHGTAGGAPSAPPATPTPPPQVDTRKAFTAVAISFVTMVFSMSMVFVALAAIAEDFGVTLRAVSWVVIIQSLVISALMMPLGRVADIVGRRKVHLVGLVLFAVGSLCVALAPTFGLMLAARAVMSLGNAMGQAVGTAMIVAIHPPHERGKALGRQTSVVAIGGAMGPIGGGLVLQVLPWEAMFLMLVPPLLVAFVAGYRYLDEAVVSASGGPAAQAGPAAATRRRFDAGFDQGGAALSAVAITLLVLTVSNPFALSWSSPPMLAGLGAMLVVLAAFVRWELRHDAPMLQLRFFTRPAFALAVTARTLGFVGYTAVIFLVPVYLIGLRGLSEGTTGAVLFLASMGMGLAANRAGPGSDRFGERPVSVVGFALHVASLAGFVLVGRGTPLWAMMILLLAGGLALGLWNVPNGSTILGSVPPENLGVVGAFMNLTRNIGSVIGQALASAVVVGIMASRGFDIPMSAIGTTAGAEAAFMEGWRVAYVLFTVVSGVALVFAVVTRPTPPEQAEPA